jgi:cytochrome c6
MKKILCVLLTMVLALGALLSLPSVAMADGDAVLGAKIFSANCASCHMRGGNLVSPAKTLKKEALAKYGMDSADKIITQVTNGKNAMPSFKGRLKGDAIANVTAYVLSQAEKGW